MPRTGDHGGAIYNTGTISLTNCTLANNTARNNGSDGNGGGLWSNNNATLTFCTLTGNSGQNGGGIQIASGSVSLKNTIVSGNTANNLGPDISNAVTSVEGVNFIGDDSDASGLGMLNTDYLTGDAMLASLGDFGGPTPTAPPLFGSPVLDAGQIVAFLPTDQRGEPRIIDSIFPNFNEIPDIGAVEIAYVQVDSLTDEDDTDFTSGDLSLREALNPANARSGTIVTFAPSLSGQTLTLSSQLEITQDLSPSTPRPWQMASLSREIPLPESSTSNPLPARSMSLCKVFNSSMVMPQTAGPSTIG